MSLENPSEPSAASGAAATDAAESKASASLLIVLLGFVLVLRLVHLSSALSSPLSYQLSPDEGYYLEFGKAVASGDARRPEFTSLDAGYGYLLGAIFKALGPNLFAVFVLQMLLDTATAYGLLVIGRLFGRPRAGLYAAALYGISATAIMYSAALLKEVWVASFVTWWVAAAVAVIRARRPWPWFFFGIYCGAGVALRANLLLLGIVALLLPWIGRRNDCRRSVRILQAVILAGGMTVALIPWSARNMAAGAGGSPLPHNGGISLHQVYNVDNPNGEFWTPPFVSYLNPGEIWRGYAAEAEARAGRVLSASEVDRYWRSQALTYIADHPMHVAMQILRKGLAFLSSAEIPDNRSTYEERLFSPVMRLLPRMTVVLVAMGLVGIAVLAIRDRRGMIVAAPVLATWLTVAVFFDADRFRFHAAALLAFGAGIWIESMHRALQARTRRTAMALGCAAAALAAASLSLGAGQPAPRVRWDQIGWGYIKMGRVDEARAVAERVLAAQPNDGEMWEVLGFTAIEGRRFEQAAQDYRRALELRPRSHVAHFNLARVYLMLGDRSRAEVEAREALAIDALPEYRALLDQILSAP